MTENTKNILSLTTAILFIGLFLYAWLRTYIPAGDAPHNPPCYQTYRTEEVFIKKGNNPGRSYTETIPGCQTEDGVFHPNTHY